MFKVEEHNAIYTKLTEGATPLQCNFWKRFLQLIEVPRASGYHTAVVEHLKAIAAEMKWECTVDDVQNVIFYVPATPGHEDAPVVCLQGHTDIVYVLAQGFKHEKNVDPIIGKIDGDWLKTATGTTLGGDDGVAVAGAIAICETEGVEHGPMELLFTSDEETGLIGASALKAGTLKAKYLLNLDSEDEGEITIGCAGGMNVRVYLEDLKREVPDFAAAGDARKVTMTIGGLAGGHTGVEIHKGRLSGITAFGRVGRALLDSGVNMRLAALTGGFAHNAICSRITAAFTVHKDDVAKFEEVATATAKAIFHEFRATDPKAEITFENTGVCCASKTCDKAVCLGPFVAKDTARVIDYALIAPFGPISFSHTVPGLVETSFSTTKVTTEGTTVEFLGSARSSVESANDCTYQKVKALATAFGARCSEQLSRYPAWEPNSESKLVKVAAECYKRTTGTEAEVLAIHAGLECGVIGAVHEGLESISIGPNVFDVHSPGERLGIQSTNRTINFTAALLKDLC